MRQKTSDGSKMSLSIFNVSVGHCHLIKHKNKKFLLLQLLKLVLLY